MTKFYFVTITKFLYKKLSLRKPVLMKNKVHVSTLLVNQKGSVEPGNPNPFVEVKMRLFLFTTALEIVCRGIEFLNTVSSSQEQVDSLYNFSLQLEKSHSF